MTTASPSAERPLAAPFPRPPRLGVLRAEAIRFWSLRSNRVQMLVFAGIVPVSVLLLSLSLRSQAAELPAGATPPPLSGTALVDSVLWAQLLLGVCSARFATAEFSTGQLGLAALAVPRRWPLVAGKAAVLAATAAGIGALSVALGLVVGWLMLPPAGIEIVLSPSRAASLVALSAGYLAGIAVVCLAIGYLVRNALLGAVLPLVLLTIGPAMLESTGLPWVIHAAGFLPSIAGRVAISAFANPAGLDGVAGSLVLAAWAIGSAALAAAVLRARDAS